MADARFAKPLDDDLIRRLAQNHEVLITVEEGSVGGFGCHVLQYLADEGLLDRGLKVRHDGAARRLHRSRQAREDVRAGRAQRPGIVATVLATLGRETRAGFLAERA